MSDAIPKILIVEDDADLQTVYSLILSSQGYRVEVAGDGFEGLQTLGAFEPDIILLDYFMPRMDGKTFLQNYDADQHPRTKVIIASNVSDQQILDELLHLGAHQTILKASLSPNDLLDLIDTTLHQ